MIMKKVYIFLAVAATALLGLNSCIKEFEPEESVVTESQVGASPTALGSMVASIPSTMYMGGYALSDGQLSYDFGIPGICVMRDSALDDLVILGDSGYDWFSTFAGVEYRGYQYSTTYLPWYTFYPLIKGVNDIIRSILANGIENASDQQKIYLGMAYAYRAYYYMHLNDVYEYKENKYVTPEDPAVVGLSCVIVDENTDESGAKYNPRATAKQVFELINADLEHAREYLNGYTQTSFMEPDYIVACALSARAYLAQSNWTEAQKWAQEVLDKSGKTPLTKDQWQDPQNGFNSYSAASNSWIWGVGLTPENTFNLHNFIAHMSTEEEWTSYGCKVARGINKYIYEKISDYDWRKQSWLDPDRSKFQYKTCLDANASTSRHPTKDLNSLPDYTNIKFRPAQGNYANYKIGAVNDFPMIRIEEMYFIKAEAQAHTSLSEAVTTLNNFMKYRWLSSENPYDCSSAASNAEFFTNELYQQKRVEFWGEGIMFTDAKRLGVGTKNGYPGTNVTGDEYLLNTEGVAPWWTFPICRAELLVNTAIPTTLNNPDPTGSVSPWKE